MQRFTLVRVMALETILLATTVWTPACRAWRVKYPLDSVRLRPTSQVVVAMACDVVGSYRQAFFRSRVLSTSAGARGELALMGGGGAPPPPPGPGGGRRVGVAS